MKVGTSKITPTTRVLAEILKKEFSGRYSFRLFRMGKERSIIVRKSTFVGVQISKCENELTIEGVQPSIPAVLFSFLLNLAGLNVPVSPFAWKNLETDLALFLADKYN
ncbi:MAG TPA: hypothetical protein VM012_05975 [Flavitalea sp.]|nr:hypothetical protein [Flavitalea sp.]